MNRRDNNRLVYLSSLASVTIGFALGVLVYVFVIQPTFRGHTTPRFMAGWMIMLMQIFLIFGFGLAGMVCALWTWLNIAKRHYTRIELGRILSGPEDTEWADTLWQRFLDLVYGPKK